MTLILFVLAIILNVIFTLKVLSLDLVSKTTSFIILMVFGLQVLSYVIGSL